MIAEDEIGICDECGSEFLKSKSKMISMCPECAHILYGYDIALTFSRIGNASNAFGTVTKVKIYKT